MASPWSRSPPRRAPLRVAVHKIHVRRSLQTDREQRVNQCITQGLNSFCPCYSDDIIIVVLHAKPLRKLKTVQDGLRVGLCTMWQITFNASKCEIITFGKAEATSVHCFGTAEHPTETSNIPFWSALTPFRNP